jgi:hydroxypyruvate isomerase
MNWPKQSFAWSFADGRRAPEELLEAAATIGYGGVDLPGQEHWPLIRSYGLTIAAVSGHDGIVSGLNRREHHQRISDEIAARLEQAVKWQIPNLICFSGNRDGLDDASGVEITAEGLSRVVSLAEDAGVTLVMETLNSKVDHPDYQCDHTTWGAEVIALVASPRVKLLYDVYHMQVMEGDIIRTIGEHHAAIGHYHTAGNPGRNEINASQELNYAAIIRAIADTGYRDWIGHEFAPLGDPIEALREAFRICSAPDGA